MDSGVLTLFIVFFIVILMYGYMLYKETEKDIRKWESIFGNIDNDNSLTKEEKQDLKNKLHEDYKKR